MSVTDIPLHYVRRLLQHRIAETARLSGSLGDVCERVVEQSNDSDPDDGGENGVLYSTRQTGTSVRAVLTYAQATTALLGSHFANTTKPLAGMTMFAEARKPCSGGPDAKMPPPLPATIGFTQLS
jgi:hypothetical protein